MKPCFIHPLTQNLGANGEEDDRVPHRLAEEYLQEARALVLLFRYTNTSKVPIRSWNCQDLNLAVVLN